MTERLIYLTDEMIDELEERYTPEPIPPCRVCGAELTIGAMGGGNATKWACSAASIGQGYPADVVTDAQKKIYRNERAEHYSASRWTEYRSGDTRVLALIQEVRDERAKHREVSA